MKAFLATVLSVIAAGVLLIAYGLLASHAPGPSQVTYDPQTGTYSAARPMFASERIALPDGSAAGYGYAGAPMQYSMPAGYRPVVYAAPVEYAAPQAPAVRTARSAAVTRTVSAARIDGTPRRNWKKTALVIGGSAASAAGIGGLIGGRKGALIGAAVGGGAGTIYEMRH